MSQSDVAIVTGASGGIGRAIAEAMLEAGHHVVSLDRRLPDWSHAKLEPVLVDLFDPKATADAAKDVAARHAVSHVVHNAGIIRPNLIEQVTVEDIAALSQLHLGAALTLVQAALPGMKQRHFGRVILIASRAALGAATRTAYSATKSGMFGMARTWALETAATASRSMWWRRDRSRPTCSTRSFRRAVRKSISSPARFPSGASAGRATSPAP